jgi:hypothetical protein
MAFEVLLRTVLVSLTQGAWHGGPKYIAELNKSQKSKSLSQQSCERNLSTAPFSSKLLSSL